MKVVLLGYREWALSTFSKFKSFPVIKSMDNLNAFLNDYDQKEKLCLIFVGWSDIIQSDIIQNHICICLHPSDLPKYRGGTPIQHQRINGIKKTKLTAFRMDNGIDSGPIIYKTDISIDGHMHDIFLSLSLASEQIINKIISTKDIDFLNGKPQRDEDATLYRRRKPKDSEITINELASSTSEELYNKICSLEDPYPNAFIKTKDNKKLLLKSVEIE
tara:strand:- start:28548 stop:29198 length:651 start_codon:yes stop_codon:yes gene_type:complete